MTESYQHLVGTRVTVGEVTGILRGRRAYDASWIVQNEHRPSEVREVHGELVPDPYFCATCGAPAVRLSSEGECASCVRTKAHAARIAGAFRGSACMGCGGGAALRNPLDPAGALLCERCWREVGLPLGEAKLRDDAWTREACYAQPAEDERHELRQVKSYARCVRCRGAWFGVRVRP